MKELAKAACRVLSIYTLIKALLIVQGLIGGVIYYNNFKFDESTLWSFGGGAVSALFLLLAAIVLWVCAGSIAAKIIGETKKECADRDEITRAQTDEAEIGAGWAQVADTSRTQTLEIQTAWMKTGGFDYAGVQSLAFSVVGVLVLSGAIPDLIRAVSNILILAMMLPQAYGKINAEEISRIIGAVMQLFLGLWLTFGSRGIVGFLKKCSEAGIKKEESD